jgi:hypothetical protein
MVDQKKFLLRFRFFLSVLALMGKGDIMKSQFSLFSAILIFFPKLVSAQICLPEPEDFKLTASFDFVVNTETLPAGNCFMHRDKTSNRLQVCEDGIVCETAETTAIQAAGTPTKPMAVFSHQGDQCFLVKSGSRMAAGLSGQGPCWSRESGQNWRRNQYTLALISCASIRLKDCPPRGINSPWCRRDVNRAHRAN